MSIRISPVAHFTLARRIGRRSHVVTSRRV